MAEPSVGAPMPDGHLRELGRVSANYQGLELSLAFIAWSLMGPDQAIGRMATSAMSFPKLCDFLSALLRYRLPAAESEIGLALLARCSDLAGRRNAVVHSAWVSDDHTLDLSRLKIEVTRKKGLIMTEEKIADVDLKKIADDIRDAVKDIGGFTTDLTEKGLGFFPAPPSA